MVRSYALKDVYNDIYAVDEEAGSTPSSGRAALAGVPSLGSLDALISELDAIEEQQATLRSAVQQRKAVVVRPRSEVSEEPEPLTPLASQRTVASGPLTGMGLGSDLLRWRFTASERAPAEDRAVPYDAQHTPSGSGSPGAIDPDSQALQLYLQRLMQQEAQVRALIARERQAAAGMSAEQVDVRSGSQGSAVFARQVVVVHAVAGNFTPRVAPPWEQSEGAVSLRGEGRDPDADLANHANVSARLRSLSVTAAAGGAAAAATLESRPTGQFYNLKSDRVAQPLHADSFGQLRLLSFVAAFAFYLFTRSTTLDPAAPGTEHAYHIVVLLAECAIFLSGALTGLWQGRQALVESKVRKDAGREEQIEQVSSTLEAQAALRLQHHVQILVYNKSSNDTQRLERALHAASTMDLPDGCSYLIHVVERHRHGQTAELLRSLALSNVTLAPPASLPGHKLTKGETLNVALRRLYPSGTAISVTDVVAVLDSDQMPGKAFLTFLLPYLSAKHVRMVHTAAIREGHTAWSDVYDEGRHHWHMHVLSRASAWGCPVCDSDSPFLIYASTLRNLGWLPTQTACLCPCLALEVHLTNRLAVYAPDAVVTGLHDMSVSAIQTRAGCAALAHSKLFLGNRAAGLGWQRVLLFNMQAWCHGVTAVTTLLFIMIPVVRIVFGVFPFRPNRWFGIGFAAYYCLFTPLLYQAYTPKGLFAAWHWTAASHNLWHVYLYAISKAICAMYTPNSHPTLQATDNTLPYAQVHVQESSLPDGPASEEHTEQGTRPSWVATLLHAAPWQAGIQSTVCLAAAAVGLWLLLGTPLTMTTSSYLTIFAANLGLVLSILWCSCYGLLSLLPVLHAALQPAALGTPESQEEARLRGSFLAAYSLAILVLALLCMLLAAVACISLGSGSYKTQDYSYQGAMNASLQFYAAQRSGPLDNSSAIPSWRGDSGLGDWPLGGYYLGTDNLKMTFPIAATVLQISWAVVSLPPSAPVDQAVLDELRWGCEYLLACRISNSTLVTQVGNMAQEMQMWTRPEDMDNARPSFVAASPGAAADIMGHTSAALAAASLAFAAADAQFGSSLLAAARQLFVLATNAEGLYSLTFVPNQKLFNSSSYLDDLVLAAAWLGAATGSPAYVAQAEAYWERGVTGANGTSWQSVVADWDNSWWAGNELLRQLTGRPRYQAQVSAFLDAWSTYSSGVAHVPGGLALAGSSGFMSNAANAALIALVYARRSSGYSSVQYACWARLQVQCMLGSCGKSYVVGVGSGPPTHIPSPAASCPTSVQPCTGSLRTSAQYSSPDPNPHVLTGALVSGPAEGVDFQDVRSAKDTAVSLEYNAGYSGALMILASKDWAGLCEARPGLIDRLGGNLPHSVW